MKLMRTRQIAVLMTCACIFSMSATGFAAENGSENTAEVKAETVMAEGAAEVNAEETDALEQIDMTKWQYNAEDDVYYQVGIVYCAAPADLTYETMGIFVPGAYLDGTENEDGTYTCAVNTEAVVENYTAATAPIVVPVETPGYSACAAPTGYQNVSAYTDAGFIYVFAGCRGRDQGAPAGVTDLKAAIRYLRYNEGVIPGDMDRIFSFGMSGGGAQSALLGATGDSELYTSYLEEIGAVEGVSDAVSGSMCWCPITNLDTADEAYEWNMGVTRSGLGEDEQQLSDDLAAAYAEYINQVGLVDEEGNVLILEESDEGIYQAGSYYEYLKNVIETSLNHFLEDTQFPYDASSSGGMGGGFGGPGKGGDFDGERPEGFGGPDMDGEFDGERPEGFGGPDMGGDFDGERPEGFGGSGMDGDFDGERPEGFGGSGMDGDFDGERSEGFADGEQNADFDGEVSYEAIDNISRAETSGGVSLSGTYESAQDYIDALNVNGTWVIYDAETNTATITSIADFVKALKQASKSLGAFDQLDEGQGENTLFGYGDGSGAHFDAIMAEILETEGSEYAQAYAEDLEQTDAQGNTAETRLNMYTPLYYLLESYEGYQTSNVAKYWRIRAGINQGDTALSTEVNLALALENYDGVETVDFETVWGQGHTQAERNGNSTDNFIEWVNVCLSAES